MSVPFIRGYPSKRCGVQSVERPLDIELMSKNFIDAGGLFFCEVLKDGKVNLFAVVMKGEEPVEVESELSENGPELLEAVDGLVRRAITHVGHCGDDDAPAGHQDDPAGSHPL